MLLFSFTSNPAWISLFFFHKLSDKHMRPHVWGYTWINVWLHFRKNFTINTCWWTMHLTTESLSISKDLQSLLYLPQSVFTFSSGKNPRLKKKTRGLITSQWIDTSRLAQKIQNYQPNRRRNIKWLRRYEEESLRNGTD
jgi:hypothetical protein